jgi:hypothetical protein
MAASRSPISAASGQESASRNSSQGARATAAPLLCARAICRSGSNTTRAPAFSASSAVASPDALSQTMISKAPSARPAARRLAAALAMVSAMSFSSL